MLSEDGQRPALREVVTAETLSLLYIADSLAVLPERLDVRRFVKKQGCACCRGSVSHCGSFTANQPDCPINDGAMTANLN
jgi:hypothetical protein